MERPIGYPWPDWVSFLDPVRGRRIVQNLLLSPPHLVTIWLDRATVETEATLLQLPTELIDDKTCFRDSRSLTTSPSARR